MTERETQLESVDTALVDVNAQFQKLTRRKIELLERKIAELDKILQERNAAIEEVSTLRSLVRDNEQGSGEGTGERTNVVAGEFASMTVWEAAEAVLRRERKELTTRQIVDRLEAGGKKLNSKNPASQVHTSISHKTDIFYTKKRRGRSLWGLVEGQSEAETAGRG